MAVETNGASCYYCYRLVLVEVVRRIRRAIARRFCAERAYLRVRVRVHVSTHACASEMLQTSSIAGSPFVVSLLLSGSVNSL